MTSTGYDAKSHARRVRPLLVRLDRLVHAGRPWRVKLPLRFRVRVVYKAAATFEDLATRFTFRTEDECRRFAGRCEGALVHRRIGRGRTWKGVRRRT